MAEKAKWLFRSSGGQIDGPLTRSQVLALIKSGVANDEDELCLSPHYWFYLREMDQLELFLENEDACMGTMALTPQIADAVQVPVIAAGGIADGRGIAASLALGAAGVQIGTAFLNCTEAGIPTVHKQELLNSDGSQTRTT